VTAFTPGDLVVDHFGPASTTGLVDSDFTVQLLKNSAASSISPVISEIGNQFYKVQFGTDLDDNSVWSIDIIETTIPRARFQQTYNLKNAEDVNVIQQNGSANNVPSNVSYIRNIVDSIFQNRFRL